MGRGIGKENASTRGPTMPSARPARFGTLPTWPPMGGSDVAADVRQIPLVKCVGIREITCCRAGADAESGHVASA